MQFTRILLSQYFLVTNNRNIEAWYRIFFKKGRDYEL